jgi:hypothetical protein
VQKRVSCNINNENIRIFREIKKILEIDMAAAAVDKVLHFKVHEVRSGWRRRHRWI